MKEIVKLRVQSQYANLLFNQNEGKNLGSSIRLVEISTDDPRYGKIPGLIKKIKNENSDSFFYGWEIKRKYNAFEIKEASLFRVLINSTFEPAGEECGTLYDESKACQICGANREQVGPLKIKHRSIPNRDIARTIGGEIVVSDKFVTAYNNRQLKGANIELLGTGCYSQLTSNVEVTLSDKTIGGINPFDYSIASGNELYKCPLGHTLGLNLLSESYVLGTVSLQSHDFFVSAQKFGVKRGLLRPESLYFCSTAFRKMVIDEGLKGFEFEVAHVV